MPSPALPCSQGGEQLTPSLTPELPARPEIVTSKSEVGLPVQSPHHDAAWTAAIRQADHGSLLHILSRSHHPDKQHRSPILLSLARHITPALPWLWHGASSPTRCRTLWILPGRPQQGATSLGDHQISLKCSPPNKGWTTDSLPFPSSPDSSSAHTRALPPCSPALLYAPLLLDINQTGVTQWESPLLTLPVPLHHLHQLRTELNPELLALAPMPRPTLKTPVHRYGVGLQICRLEERADSTESQ